MSSLDMYGLIDPAEASTPPGGVQLITEEPGDYSGPGGQWVPGAQTAGSPRTLRNVSIQPASMKTAEFLAQAGGVAKPSDLRVVYINDGTMLWPDDDGTFAQLLRFSDGEQVRDWRVRDADNRPWHSYCKAVVERYRGSR